MSTQRSWALIEGNFICQKDGKEVFRIDSVNEVFNAFNEETKLYGKLYFFKQCLQDYKSGESNADTMKERLEQLKNGLVKVRRSFERKSATLSLNAAIVKAETKKGRKLTKEEIETLALICD